MSILKSAESDSPFKKCPVCETITNQLDVYYCPKCNVRYERISEEEAIFKPKFGSQQQKDFNENEYIPKCPTCNSVDIKKISVISKAGSVFLWGVFAVGKVAKQWQCNNCGSEW